MIELLNNLSEEEANICILVLASAGIACHVSREDELRWTILVWQNDYEKALSEIRTYYLESDFGGKESTDAAESWYDNSGGLWPALVILICHIAMIRNGGIGGYIEKFGLSADAVCHGELYRVVTALMIHSGSVHLIGNLAGIVIFVTPVCGIQGFGMGLLSVVLSGAFGNYFTALLYHSGHVSVGASTAVFGAVGILAAHQFFRKIRDASQRFRAWLPLGGGVCLLGLFSAGAHTDIIAHLFGFAGGIASGCLYEVFTVRRPSSLIQYLSLAAVLGMLLLSWMRIP